MKQQTDYKLGKEYVKAVYCHSAYLTYMQNTFMQNAKLDEAQVGIKISRRNISNLRYANDIILRQQRGTKEPLDEGERVKKLA